MSKLEDGHSERFSGDLKNFWVGIPLNRDSEENRLIKLTPCNQVKDCHAYCRHANLALQVFKLLAWGDPNDETYFLVYLGCLAWSSSFECRTRGPDEKLPITKPSLAQAWPATHTLPLSKPQRCVECAWTNKTFRGIPAVILQTTGRLL